MKNLAKKSVWRTLGESNLFCLWYSFTEKKPVCSCKHSININSISKKPFMCRIYLSCTFVGWEVFLIRTTASLSLNSSLHERVSQLIVYLLCDEYEVAASCSIPKSLSYVCLILWQSLNFSLPSAFFDVSFFIAVGVEIRVYKYDKGTQSIFHTSLIWITNSALLAGRLFISTERV